MRVDYPFLSDYVDDWPVSDMLFVYLKNARDRNKKDVSCSPD